MLHHRYRLILMLSMIAPIHQLATRTLFLCSSNGSCSQLYEFVEADRYVDNKTPLLLLFIQLQQKRKEK